jgi:hypothetical protein
MECFDSVTVPLLPPGWSSSRNRYPNTNDFATTSSLPRSSPNAVLATNATIEQWLSTPPLDFSGIAPASLDFEIRRSSSHGSRLLLEASLNDGVWFDVRAGDTLAAASSPEYMRVRVPLPPALAGRSQVFLRWRFLPASTGSTGTVRIDDVLIDVVYSRNLSLVSFVVDPPAPREGEPVTAVLRVKNRGTLPIPGFALTVFDDSDGDDVPEDAEQLTLTSMPLTLAPGDSVDVQCPLGPLQGGSHRLISHQLCRDDQQPLDDLLCISVFVGFPSSCAIINEIMYQPFAGDAEYVEFVNAGPRTIDLCRWVLRDDKGPGVILPPVLNGATVLPPGGVAVVASDSSIFNRFPALREMDPGRVLVRSHGFPALNNSGDRLVLCDPTGSVIDSVAYDPAWHNPAVVDHTGRSLEKLAPMLTSNDRRSWSTCLKPEGGTPGLTNSIFTLVVPGQSRLSFSPNPFSPDNDGRDDVVLVYYEVPVTPTTLNISIYDVRGRLIRRLANNEHGGLRGEIPWDGRDDQGRCARIGMYVVLLESVDEKGGQLFTAKGVVVLAGKL